MLVSKKFKIDKANEFNYLCLHVINELSNCIELIYFAKIRTAIKWNIYIIIDYFVLYILPYSDKIMAKDELYFTNIDNFKEYSHDIVLEISKLIDIYNSLNITAKNNIWEYIQALLILANEYILLKNNI